MSQNSSETQIITQEKQQSNTELPKKVFSIDRKSILLGLGLTASLFLTSCGEKPKANKEIEQPVKIETVKNPPFQKIEDTSTATQEDINTFAKEEKRDSQKQSKYEVDSVNIDDKFHSDYMKNYDLHVSAIRARENNSTLSDQQISELKEYDEAQLRVTQKNKEYQDNLLKKNNFTSN